jgi:hypothetical protein
MRFKSPYLSVLQKRHKNDKAENETECFVLKEKWGSVKKKDVRVGDFVKVKKGKRDRQTEPLTSRRSVCSCRFAGFELIDTKRRLLSRDSKSRWREAFEDVPGS